MCKEPDSKYFSFQKLIQPYNLCCNYSTQSLDLESSYTQYLKEQVWLCSNKALFTKSGMGWAIVCQP